MSPALLHIMYDLSNFGWRQFFIAGHYLVKSLTADVYFPSQSIADNAWEIVHVLAEEPRIAYWRVEFKKPFSVLAMAVGAMRVEQFLSHTVCLRAHVCSRANEDKKKYEEPISC